ncbi:DedA family protein [Microbacterium sp. YY-01]|uniref:DedA family protein n=1 Tax=Microbacterium sp. YY-01 TaxID=3421634 RepID=UPI003D184795
MDEFLLGFLDLVQSVDPVLRTIIAGVAMMLETSILIGLIVPGDTIVLVAGIGVTNVVEALALAGAIVIGALAGESFGFWMGHWAGPYIRQSWAGRKIGAENWNRAERYLQRRGGLAIFLSRFLPVLHSVVPMTVGMSRYSYRRFLAWTTPACILWAAAYVSVTWAAADSYRELARRFHFAGYVFVGIILAFLLLALLVKKLIARAEARHMDAVEDNENVQD